jgi:magnesium-dependent phosphatase 1
MAAVSAVVSLLIWTIVGHCYAFHLTTNLERSKFMSKSQFDRQLRRLHSSNGESSNNKPRIVVFDLDGCLWRPEMYELLWDGHASPFEPFEPTDLTKLKSKLGTVVTLIGDVAEILDELYTDPEWENVDLGISSRTDEPTWARELLQKFTLPRSKVSLETVFTGPWEIAHDQKTRHFERISQATGVALENMLFFDNEAGNCRTVSKLGVSVCYCPNGVTRDAFNRALECFPCSLGQIVGIDL